MVSIIIRTKNEGRWIKNCLDSIEEQTFKDYEIVIVDNCSIDNTLSLVLNHTLYQSKKIKLVRIESYIPGKALNDGITNSTGNIIVCISAHCIPKDENWLQELINPLLSSEYVATYGRQVPMPYSSPEDIRDLSLVFLKDSRIQKKDFFFHNAHSAFTRNVWEKFPFNEDLTNIEDRLFGKNLIDNGYEIYYNATPTVYHYHGIHQTGNKTRLEGVIRIMRHLDDEISSFPKLCVIDKQRCILFVPIIKQFNEISEEKFNEIAKYIDKISRIEFFQNTMIIAFPEVLEKIKTLISTNALFFDRTLVKDNENIGVFQLIKETIFKSEEVRNNFNIGVYYSTKYSSSNYLVESLRTRLKDFPHHGVDIVFPGKKDSGYYWYLDDGMQLPVSYEKELKLNTHRKPLYQAFYGAGSIFHISSIMEGNILDKSVLIDEIE